MPCFQSRLNFLLILFLLFILFFVAIFGGNHSPILSNLYIPDGYLTYFDLFNVVVGEQPYHDYSNTPIIFYIYNIPIKYFGLLGPFFINVLVLLILYYVHGIRLFIIVTIFFPLMSQSILFPSKDLLVVLFYALFCFCLNGKKFLLAGLITVSVFFLRDGAFFVLLSLFFTYFLVSHEHIKSWYVAFASFLFGYILSLNLSSIIGGTYIFNRNLNVFKIHAASKFQDIDEFLLYPFKYFFNLTNLSFRPVFLDVNGGLSLVYIALFVSGLSLLVSFFLALYYSGNLDRDAKFFSASFFVSLAVISLNPLVQPRYQFPVAIMTLNYFAGNISNKQLKLLYVIALICSAIFFLIYLTSGIQLPPFYEIENIFIYS